MYSRLRGAGVGRRKSAGRKIGPVKARFSGKVALNPSKFPDAFSLAGEGDGGVAGFAKDGADVDLVADGDKTILRYCAKAEIG